MTTQEKPLCGVCLNHFTTVIRQPVQCPYCPDSSCRQCTSQYLLTTLDDPHCMHCKREWNRDFIDTKLTQTFRKGPLRLHRRKVLMDREKARLPGMQVYVEARKEYDLAEVKYIEFHMKRRQLKKQRNAIQAEYAAKDTFEQLSERLRPINQERSDLKVQMQEAAAKMRAANEVLTGKKKETRQFIMKCPGEECRGFLSTAWKCGTCLKFFCADCHAEKAAHQDDTHTCNADAKATASMIRQETRPCPKCGIRISKIEGCDQMWCTACQTTFSWNTGQILLNTVVHNPHYYEYLRRTNNGIVPREAGDVPCGGLPNGYTFTRVVQTIPRITLEQANELQDTLRCLTDIQYVRLPQFPLRRGANTTQGVDVAYLCQEMTEEEWGAALERMETAFERKKEIGLILQTMLHVGSEKLTQLHNSRERDDRTAMALAVLAEMRRVRDYTNKCLVEKGTRMGMIVPQISRDWMWTRLRKAEMKNAVEEQGDNDLVPTPEPRRDVGHVQEDVLFVEIEGEMVEMTRAQAAQILA